ncbi:sporulation initiation inhibitor protein Soj [Bacteroides sp. CAG:530]|mgnify:CR=1 FL=1|nr:sporulation initiation inhibitor protein Soj [Bacteroides sp. CAG:530]
MSLKIITLANYKGGVSKASSTASIGACMARMGKKVLLIDLDGQANLTMYFIPNEEDNGASIFDSLVNNVPLPVKHIKENLDLVPSSLEMASAEIAMTNLLAREQLLSRLLEPVRQNYDYILIDCPPSLGIVTTNAFLAADEIIVPMTPELLPLKGMRLLDAFVTSLQRIKPSLRLGGVFIARYNHRKLNKAVEEAVKSRYEAITFKTRIRENIALAESAGSGKSIFEYDPQSNGAKDYQALTEEIISRNQ